MTRDVRPAIHASPGRPYPLSLFGRVAIVLIILLVVGAYVGVRMTELPFMRGPHGYVLTDPDSHMRWRLVRRALAGEGVRIGWIDDDNAPIGRINEWTSPMTIVGVGAVRAVEMVTGATRERALELAPLFITPALGLLALAALGVLGWRAGGWPLGVAWIVAWPVLEDVLSVTRPGNVDHHALHQLLATVIYGLCLFPGRRPAWTGTAAGLAAAGLLWATASEGLVVLAPLGVFTVMSLGVAKPTPEHAPAFWRAFWITALAGSAAALVFEFWPQPWHTRLEMIGPWQVFVLLLAVVVVEILCRVRLAPWQTIGLVLAVAGLIGLAALALRGFHVAALHTVQDPRFQAMTRVLMEFHPFLGGRGALARLWDKFGLLPLAVPAGLFLLWRCGDGGRRLMFGATLLLAVLTCWEGRWVSFLAPLLVMSFGLAAQHWLPRRGWLVVAAAAVATVGPMLHGAAVVRFVLNQPHDPGRGPYGTTIALQAAAECLGGSGEQPIVLAPWDAGAMLAGTGRVRVIGSQYWSNAAGCVDTIELFTTHDAARFASLLRERQVRFIVLPDPQTLSGIIAESYFALHGERPARRDVQEAVLVRRLMSGAFWQVPCEALSRWRGDWKVLRVE